MTPDKLKIPKEFINFERVKMDAVKKKKKPTRQEILAEKKDRKAREKAIRLNAEEQRLLAHKAREERLKKAAEEKAKLKEQRREVAKANAQREGPTEKQKARHETYLKWLERHEERLKKQDAIKIANFRRKVNAPPNATITYDRKTDRFSMTTEVDPANVKVAPTAATTTVL